MAQRISESVSPTTIPAEPTNLSSFVYEDLISHVQAIRQQEIECIKYLEDRINNDKKIKDQLQTRPLTIVDPYGNSITESYMNHEQIGTVLKKFKKNYVPKYLHQWNQFGQIIEDDITPLEQSQLDSIVARYYNINPIITHGQITVWIFNKENISTVKVLLKVRLSDTIETIRGELKKRINDPAVEFKAIVLEENTKPELKTWNEGVLLRSEDTILSKMLYQEKWIIMVKTTPEIDTSEYRGAMPIFVELFQGKRMLVKYNPSVTIKQIKMKINYREEIAVNEIRLLYRAVVLKNEQTLADYDIREGSSIYFSPKLCGGMYHLTSGRQDFQKLPFESAMAIKETLAFQFTDVNNLNQLTMIELQESILNAQNVLFTLLNQIQEYSSPDNLPNVSRILQSNEIEGGNNDQGDDSDD